MPVYIEGSSRAHYQTRRTSGPHQALLKSHASQHCSPRNGSNHECWSGRRIHHSTPAQSIFVSVTAGPGAYSVGLEVRTYESNLHDQPRQKLTPSKHLEIPSNICAGEADPSLIVVRAKRRGVGVSAPSVRCHDRL